jgi:hypothetical protein
MCIRGRSLQKISIRTVLHPHAEGIYIVFPPPTFYIFVPSLSVFFHDPAQLTQFFSGIIIHGIFFKELNILHNSGNLAFQFRLRFYFFPWRLYSGQMKPFDKVPINNGLLLLFFDWNLALHLKFDVVPTHK